MPNPVFGKHHHKPHFGHPHHPHPGKQPPRQPSAHATTPPIPFLPLASAFVPQIVDVYTGSGSFPPSPGNLRISRLSCLVTGSPIEGTRSRNSSTFGYTHVMLVDPGISLQDAYTQDNVAEVIGSPPGTADTIAIPAGQTSNLWVVVFSCLTNIPGIGHRKVALLDRHGTPGSWPSLV